MAGHDQNTVWYSWCWSSSLAENYILICRQREGEMEKRRWKERENTGTGVGFLRPPSPPSVIYFLQQGHTF